MERDHSQLGSLNLSPRSRRVIEASIAAHTAGAPFWTLHGLLFCFVGFLAIVAWGAAAWSAAATLQAAAVGLEALGIPFFGFFAIVATIVWSAELRLLRRALRLEIDDVS